LARADRALAVRAGQAPPPAGGAEPPNPQAGWVAIGSAVRPLVFLHRSRIVNRLSVPPNGHLLSYAFPDQNRRARFPESL